MKSSPTSGPSRPARAIGIMALVMVLSLTPARADMTVGKMTQDITVGANHDVKLQTGEVVQILKQSADTTVIMVPLPDGSNGIFQIHTRSIQIAPPGTPLGLPPPPPPPPAAPGTIPPKYPDNFAGAATFQTTLGDHTTGVAGVIKLPDADQAYILSTRQLLGPLGGFETQVAAKDVPSIVQHIQIAGYNGSTKTYDVTGLLVRGAHPRAEGGTPFDDLAIYRLNDSTAQPQAVVLASQPPAIGDIVWVIAKMRGVPDGQLAQRGQVTANTKWLEMQFDNDNTITSGSSGAPVLNNAGEVVGIFSSHLTESGHVRGYIIPISAITKTIQGH